MAAGYLTTAEAAEKLGLTVRAVQKMIEAGRLGATKAGRDYLIKAESLVTIPRKSNAGRPPKAGAKAAPAKKPGRKR